MLHVNIIKSHVHINKFHVNKIFLHVDIIHSHIGAEICPLKKLDLNVLFLKYPYDCACNTYPF